MPIDYDEEKIKAAKNELDLQKRGYKYEDEDASDLKRKIVASYPKGRPQEEELSEGNGTMITGMPPKSGDKRLVAWFRTGRVDINPLKVGEVEGYEK